MKHIYLTQANIQKSMITGVITYKEANELTAKLEGCAKSVVHKEVIRHGIVTRHIIVSH